MDPDLDPDPHSSNFVDPDPHTINADSHHYSPQHIMHGFDSGNIVK